MKRLLAVLALSLSASAHAADAVAACDIRVFPIDPDPKGTNVRSGPAADSRVAGVIASQDSELDVTGSQGKWLRISRAEGVDGTSFFAGEGWVFAALTGVTARSSTKLHASPDPASPVVGSMAAAEQGAVLWTSHNMYEVSEACDRVLFLANGRIVLQGEPDALMREHGQKTLEDLFVSVAAQSLEGAAP